jgi:hypothetical protein
VVELILGGGAETEDCSEDVEIECAFLNPFAGDMCRFGVELVADISCINGLGCGSAIRVLSSCPTHRSHNSHPNNVAIEPHPATETGESFS